VGEEDGGRGRVGGEGKDAIDLNGNRNGVGVEGEDKAILDPSGSTEVEPVSQGHVSS
jgi:hypothetical protein